MVINILEGPAVPIFRVILLIIYPTFRCEITEISVLIVKL